MPELTAEHGAVLAAVLERLLPEDENGPGAMSLGVDAYAFGALDGALAHVAP